MFVRWLHSVIFLSGKLDDRAPLSPKSDDAVDRLAYGIFALWGTTEFRERKAAYLRLPNN